MGLIIDGTTIATSANVFVDGTPVSTVFIDGTPVWTKAAQQLTSVDWQHVWSGSLLIAPFDYAGGWDGMPTGDHYGTYGYDEVSIDLIHGQNGDFVNGSITPLLQSKLIQAEAYLFADCYHTNGLVYQNTNLVGSLQADTASSTLTNNLPWEPGAPNGEEASPVLDMTSVVGSRVTQTALTMWTEDYVGDYVYYVYFGLSNLYAGMPKYT